MATNKEKAINFIKSSIKGLSNKETPPQGEPHTTMTECVDMLIKAVVLLEIGD